MCLLFRFCQNALKLPQGAPWISRGGRGEKVLIEGSRGAFVNEKHSGGFI